MTDPHNDRSIERKPPNMNNPEPVILTGDCLERLKELPDNSVDAVITDPPYGLSNTDPQRVADTIARWASGDTEYVPKGRGFMGASWDGFVPPPAVWEECMRVLKPGGHMAVFAGARTQDLMGLSIRLAGFDIRDGLSWIYGSGFPKGQDIGKQIDKMKGAKREVVGPRVRVDGKAPGKVGGGKNGTYGDYGDLPTTITAPATDEARQWDGWNSQLKPSQEPIILARKPLDGTVAANVLAHGVGGLNIDACRVGMSDADREAAKVPQPAMRPGGEDSGHALGSGTGRLGAKFEPAPAGRFPANVLLDEHAAKEMDKQSGWQKDGVAVRHRGVKGGEIGPPGSKPEGTADMGYGGGGGASRFFPVFKYQAKAPKRERPVIEREDGTKIQHPTVKPVALMEWLVELITPPGGTVLDPFAGSGTTLQAARNNGFQSTGIEQEEEYVALIHERLNTKHRTRIEKEADR